VTLTLILMCCIITAANLTIIVTAGYGCSQYGFK